MTSVTPVSETTYIVSVTTGSGSGTIQLNVVDNDSIMDAASHSLGGAGRGNGNFTTGEVCTLQKSNTVSASFKSAGAYDGWILESGENTSRGGTLDKNATTFNLGDDQKDRQYRSILSFDTSSLPDNVVVVTAQLKIKRQGIVGIDPFETHGALALEIRSGSFGNSAVLAAADFSAPASAGTTRDSFAPLTFSWYAAQLSNANLGLINKAGATQFRLLFSKDDNDDLSAAYMKFFSGNSINANLPELAISYYVP